MLSDVTVTDISQRYKMQQVLGSGAQATVYAATSKKSQRKVAVKVRAAAALSAGRKKRGACMLHTKCTDPFSRARGGRAHAAVLSLAPP